MSAPDPEEGVSDPEEPPAAASTAWRKRAGRHSCLAALAVVCLGVSATLLFLYDSYRPVGLVRGIALGPATKVVLVDHQRQVRRDAILDEEGKYQVLLPPQALEPMVVIHGPQGTLVESGVFSPEARQLKPLRLWQTPLRIRTRGRRVRFDWAAVPTGEGYPARARYSVLLRFNKRGGEQAEVTLLAEKTTHEMSLRELTQLLKDWDPEQRTLRVELRVFDPREQKEGGLWVGATREWILP